MRIVADRFNHDPRLRDSAEQGPRVDETGGSRSIDPERQADFAKAVESSQARHRQGSLQAQVEQLALPAAGDPSLYGNENGIALLQHLVDNVLPRMEVEADIADMAARMLNEEIELRLEWAVRRAEAEEQDA